MRIPLRHPRPNIEDFKKVILREKVPDRPISMEHHLDKEVIKEIIEKKLGGKWVEPLPGDRETQEASLKNYIECHYRLGYDCFRLTGQFRFARTHPRSL